MLPLVIIPASLVSFLVGLALAQGHSGLTMMPQSPLPGVLLVRWLRFTRRMARYPRDYESPRGHLGTFGMDPRRLYDVGLTHAPRKTTVGREAGVWTSEWRSPLTKEKYLSSTPLQYESFKRSVAGMVPAAEELVGSDADGERCTLSGLLGVGHLAGAAGIASWVKDPLARKKFARTTAAFKLTNGIF